MSKLLIVINNTNQPFQFTNLECANDNKAIQAFASNTLPSINLTSGQYGEGCDIPDCSAEKYYPEHRMEFISDDQALQFAFWFDDSKNNFYYTKTGSFSDAQVIPGNVSHPDNKKAIYIMNDETLLITDIQ